MIDQIAIGAKASYDDFEASVNRRSLAPPQKKSIRETVPFSNLTYDFSAINGELYWEDRPLEYVFEITADTPEALEQKKALFLAWVMNVQNEEIRDPFIPDYHFIATFDSVDVEDDESIEKTTIKVGFLAYPYKVANEPKEYVYTIDAGEEVVAVVENRSAHRITPTFSASVGMTVTIGTASYGIPAGITTDGSLMLAVGENTLAIKNTAGESGVLTIAFYEEVF